MLWSFRIESSVSHWLKTNYVLYYDTHVRSHSVLFFKFIIALDSHSRFGCLGFAYMRKWVSAIQRLLLLRSESFCHVIIAIVFYVGLQSFQLVATWKMMWKMCFLVNAAELTENIMIFKILNCNCHSGRLHDFNRRGKKRSNNCVLQSSHLHFIEF